MKNSQYPAGVELEEIACPIDGCTAYDVVVTGHDILYKVPGEFRVVKCRECGLMRTSPRATQETIGAYYPDDYSPFVMASPKNYGGLKGALLRLTDPYSQKIPVLPVGRALEIGCASGNYMQVLADEGWHVDGIEPSPDAAENARQRGFEVHTGSLENAPERDAIYDMIVGWMVVEHLHTPVEALRKLHRMAKPGAWFAFSVPNAGSFERRLFGKSWYALHISVHLFHYTPETIEKMLEKSGWRLEKIYHQRTLANFFQSMGYWLENRGHSGRLSRFLTDFSSQRYIRDAFFPLGWVFSLFGQTGRMTVWARRMDD